MCIYQAPGYLLFLGFNDFGVDDFGFFAAFPPIAYDANDHDDCCDVEQSTDEPCRDSEEETKEPDTDDDRRNDEDESR